MGQMGATLRKVVGIVLVVIGIVAFASSIYVVSRYETTTTLIITTVIQETRFEGDWGWVASTLVILCLIFIILGEIIGGTKWSPWRSTKRFNGE